MAAQHRADQGALAADRPASPPVRASGACRPCRATGNGRSRRKGCRTARPMRRADRQRRRSWCGSTFTPSAAAAIWSVRTARSARPNAGPEGAAVAAAARPRSMPRRRDSTCEIRRIEVDRARRRRTGMPTSPDGPPVMSIKPHRAASRSAGRRRGSRAPGRSRAAACRDGIDSSRDASHRERDGGQRRPMHWLRVELRGQRYTGRVAADRHEPGLAEVDLAGIAHRNVEPDERDEQDAGDDEARPARPAHRSGTGTPSGGGRNREGASGDPGRCRGGRRVMWPATRASASARPGGGVRRRRPAGRTGAAPARPADSSASAMALLNSEET